MRQNLQKVAAAHRRRNGRGPLYQHLTAVETAADRRYRPLGRPRVLLDRLRAGEPVEVPMCKVPLELRPRTDDTTLVVTPDM